MTDVSKLEGAELDATVAEFEHQKYVIERVTVTSMAEDGTPLHTYVDELRCLRVYKSFDGTEKGGFWLGYSTHWELAGPIIERERINIQFVHGGGSFKGDIQPEDGWLARVEGETFNERGPTPLIAAMRAFVASRAAEIGLAGRGKVGGAGNE